MSHSHRVHYFHAIWSTKNRQRYIDKEIQQRLYEYIGGIARNYKGRILEIGGTSDHIHILIEISLPDNFSQIFRSMKSNSSSWLHNNFPHLQDFAWQDGYGSFSVSYSSLDQIKNYIKNQEKHHQHFSFDDEYKLFLKKHGIDEIVI